MKATEYEKLRASISSSRANGEPYKIDLASYSGHGFCTCRDWECARWPRIRDREPPSDDTRCKHVKYLRRQLAQGCVLALHEEYKDRAFDLLEFRVIDSEGTFIVNLLERDGNGICECSLFKEIGECQHIEGCRDDLASRLIREFIRLYPSNEET
jgi:hypothetical protein